MIDAVINFKHIEPHQFLEEQNCDRACAKRHAGASQYKNKHGVFVAGDKRANKSITTRNYELFRTSDL